MKRINGVEFFGAILGGAISALALAVILWAVVPESPADTLTIPYTFSNGTVADATKVNADFTAISNVVNGLIDDSNVKNAGVTGSTKLVNASVTLAKMAPDSVASANIVNSTIVSADVFDGTLVSTDLALGAATNYGNLFQGGSTVLTTSYAQVATGIHQSIGACTAVVWAWINVAAESFAGDDIRFQCQVKRDGNLVSCSSGLLEIGGTAGVPGHSVLPLFCVELLAGSCGPDTWTVECKELDAADGITITGVFGNTFSFER